ncbi:MAG TPA: glycoside hydrolase family 3 C-terminal domain-containing protein [Candidatus Borkfalkia faecigallinarum]|uniref:Glycoside hydrolase family 3 C-terminal domain-containing protein n=1 Tax=Candidatus Borkfalkia faecigallinarum TaxID=2838509 RepID=A0A9D2ARG6_9FIRM|nr:glycoside hydrolase family 3 C-terminal domain-containing protein [Candidatus Borkfalkia faecigallinarum]
MNPVFAQFLKDNLAFVIIACIAAAGAIAAGVIMALTARKAKAGGGFFVGGKRLTVKYVLVALVLVVLLFGNYVLYSFSGTITLALCGSGVQVDEVAMNASSANSAALCVEIGEDGMTLLKNNGTLPLAENNKKINVFGWSGSDNGFVHQGAGSGGGTDTDITTLYQGLRESGFEINEELAEKYNAMSYRREGWDYYKLPEGDESFYTSELMENAKAFSDTALIVLGRKGGETSDLPRYQQNLSGKRDPTRMYSQTSALEDLMIEKVTANFDKVIVVFNTTNVMEAGFLENEKIDAAIAMYAPGSKATPALGNLLQGKANFSGKTVDTWAYDLTTSAAWANAGVDGTHTVNASGSEKAYISNYAEGIYMGYWWYETADKEGFWESDFAKDKWDIENGYADVVQFPFGYGLSYTEFAWSVESVSMIPGSQIAPEDEIEIEVFVQNTGSRPGKDVVQLYLELPYREGGIEKPAVKLAAFAKTSELEHGEGELLKLSVRVSDFASYDVYDTNNNGFMGYEIEGGIGDYVLSLRTNAHEIAEVGGLYGATFDYRVPDEGYRLENDPVTGNKVENRFTNYTNPVSGASSVTQENALSDLSKAYSVDGSDTPYAFEYMTRADFEGTFPTFGSYPSTMDTQFYQETYVVNTPKIVESDVMPLHSSDATDYQLLDFIYEVTDDAGNPVLDEEGNKTYGLVPYEDERWDQLVSQMSLNDLYVLSAGGGFGTQRIDSVGKPAAVDKDGPCGFNSLITGSGGGTESATNFPCETLIASTWDWKLSYRFGLALSAEGNALGVDGLYGPAVNIHRNVLNGRNFEYYSEDPYISGIMCAYTVYGCKENGVYCWIKHFALNENETGRTHMYQFCTEQALREIYLRPYEIAVKEGGANAIMTAYGRVGTVRASGSSALNTAVLRGEWGFKGAVITDYYNAGVVHDADECIRAGNDLMLDPNGRPSYFGDQTSATAVIALQSAAKHILYSYLETKYTAQVSTGLDLSTLVGNRTDVFAWWIPVAGVIDGLIVVGCAAFAVLSFLNFRKSQKAQAAEE